MPQNVTKLPIKKHKRVSAVPQMWRPFESLRGEIDRLFEDFGQDLWRPFGRSFFATEPLLRRELTWPTMPVDVVENEKTFEVTADLPGIDKKNIEVKVANGILSIKGEKQEEKEERKKDFYLRERNFGSLERNFSIPETVDADKIEASFKKGVLKVTLPKTVEAQKPAKKVEVKAA